MDDTLVREAIRGYVADEPPIRLTSTAVLEAGRRSRRWRLAGSAALCAGALTGIAGLAAVIIATLLPSGGTHAGTVDPPDQATCAAILSRDWSHGPVGEVDVKAAADRMSCFLMAEIPTHFPPGTRFFNNPARPGTAALVASPDPMGNVGDLAATAEVKDAQGEGLIVFAISRNPDPMPAEVFRQQCESATAKARCTTGPHGEAIQIFDFGPDGDGVHGRTIYVFSGHTRILATANNAPEADGARPTRDQPPLTVDQLIAVATAPELAIYP